MNRLSALLGIRKKAAPQPAPHPPSPPYLTQTVVFGHGDSSVFFVDESRGIRKTLVDSSGIIFHFPGIDRENYRFKEIVHSKLLPKIRYRTSFEKRENKWIMLWTVQPDGAYWADEDGFGMENEDEIVLYTYVDMNGDFTGPFRIYQIGNVCCSLDRFEHAHAGHYIAALQALRSGKMTEHVDVLFPRLYGMDLQVGIRHVWEYYTLLDQAHAAEYWAHPVLSQHLCETVNALLLLDDPVIQIVGYPEYKMVQACMTLFYSVTREPVFQAVLDKFFEGQPDQFTMTILSL